MVGDSLAQPGELNSQERSVFPRRAPDLQRGGGFGLNAVEILSRRWGVHRDVGTRV